MPPLRFSICFCLSAFYFLVTAVICFLGGDVEAGDFITFAALMPFGLLIYFCGGDPGNPPPPPAPPPPQRPRFIPPHSLPSRRSGRTPGHGSGPSARPQVYDQHGNPL